MPSVGVPDSAACLGRAPEAEGEGDEAEVTAQGTESKRWQAALGLLGEQSRGAPGEVRPGENQVCRSAQDTQRSLLGRPLGWWW